MGRPLTLVLDEARDQRCVVVQAWAEALRIEWLFRPASAPNLNLFERRWKFVKKGGLSCRYDEDFRRFQAALAECLEGVEGKHTLSIKSLRSLNFQTFEEPQLLAG